MWVSGTYVWMWMVCLSVWYDDFFASLPFCLLVCYVWTLLLRWSSTLLMWADVRTPGGGDGNGDVVAWRIGQVLDPLWGPLPVIFLLFMFFLDKQDIIFLNYVVQYISGWAMWGPFLVIRVFWTYCIHSYPKPRTLWLFMYVMFY